MRWVVKNLLPAQGLAIMYGKSGTGKTFLLLDLLLSIANGIEWFGHTVAKTPVCYVCLEGIGGIQQRISAWEIATGKPVPDNFRVITNPFALVDRKDVLDLATSIRDSGFSSGVVAIDTLNAATPRMDENSSKEMGNVIDNLRHLQRETNGLVLTSHHTGKDERQGMRGHSSLHGAIDSEIYLKGMGTNRTWRLQKMRDFENGEAHNFKLVIHDLGFDDDGATITSCSVESDTPPSGSMRKPRGKNQRLVFDQLRNLIDEKSKNTVAPCEVKFDTAIENAAIALHDLAKNKRRNVAEKIVHDLIDQNYFKFRIENGIESIGIV